MLRSPLTQRRRSAEDGIRKPSLSRVSWPLNKAHGRGEQPGGRAADSHVRGPRGEPGPGAGAELGQTQPPSSSSSSSSSSSNLEDADPSGSP